MKPQNTIDDKVLEERGFTLVGKGHDGQEVYHSYREERGLVVKPVNGKYRIANSYSIKGYYNQEQS